MGIDFEGVEGVEEVIIRTRDREIVISSPLVTRLHVQGQLVFQIAGGEVEERPLAREGVEVSEEDVQLVASQAGVSLEEARKALIEARGDLAKAILLLTGG